jgi:hypothetical protein
MVDDMHIDRHQLALGQQVGHADRRDGRRRDLASRSLALTGSWITGRLMIVVHDAVLPHSCVQPGPQGCDPVFRQRRSAVMSPRTPAWNPSWWSRGSFARVRASSGAVAVQIVTRRARRLGQVEHLGSAAHRCRARVVAGHGHRGRTRRPADLRAREVQPGAAQAVLRPAATPLGTSMVRSRCLGLGARVRVR